jgi:uncharacterized protein YodC (DUF2158 family)
MKFTVGSTAKLKSGGPPLKVVDVSGYYVMVSWIEDGEERRDVFRDVCLVPA